MKKIFHKPATFLQFLLVKGLWPSIDFHYVSEIEKYLIPFIWLVPKWCQKLSINLYPIAENDANAIETTTYYDYRRIKINFYSAWLSESPEAKQTHIVHDLLHGFTSPAIDYAINQFNLLCPIDEAEKFNKSINQQMSILCESVTQDLAYAILNNEKQRNL